MRRDAMNVRGAGDDGPRTDATPLLRGAVALLAVAAAVIAVLWTLGVVAFFDDDFNPRARPGAPLLGGRGAVGVCGILSLCVAAVRGGQYARTGRSSRLPRAGFCLLPAVPCGALWILLAVGASAS
jgi:hypothetical protein